MNLSIDLMMETALAVVKVKVKGVQRKRDDRQPVEEGETYECIYFPSINDWYCRNGLIESTTSRELHLTKLKVKRLPMKKEGEEEKTQATVPSQIKRRQQPTNN